MNYKSYKRKNEALEGILNALVESVEDNVSPSMFGNYTINNRTKREIVDNSKFEIIDEFLDLKKRRI